MGCASSASVIAACPETPIGVTFIGLPGTGKTSIIEYLAGDYDPRFSPISTNELSIRSLCIHNKPYTFYDTSGLLLHKDDWSGCIEMSNAIILTFDSIAVDYSPSSVKTTLTDIEKIIGEDKIPILGIFTKTDDTENKEYKMVKEMFEDHFSDKLYSLKLIKKLDDSIFDIFKFIEEQAYIKNEIKK